MFKNSIVSFNTLGWKPTIYPCNFLPHLPAQNMSTDSHRFKEEDIPAHVKPFPTKPSTQSQVKLPTVSVQSAFASQSSNCSSHSLTSAGQSIIHSAIST